MCAMMRHCPILTKLRCRTRVRGVDMVAPSDMMDGRIASMRAALATQDLTAAYYVLRRQIRLVVLRPVPRGGRVCAVVRRSENLSDGHAQRTRSVARERDRRGGGCGHSDGQARFGVS